MEKILIRELVDTICVYLDIQSIINLHICYNYPLSVKWLLQYQYVTSRVYACTQCEIRESTDPTSCSVCYYDICVVCKKECDECDKICCEDCITTCMINSCDMQVCINCIETCPVCCKRCCPEHMISNYACGEICIYCSSA